MRDSYLAEYMRKTRPDIFDVRPFTYEKKEETPLVEIKIPELHEKLLEAIDKMIPMEGKMVKRCATCKYENLELKAMPCRDCSFDSKWEPKEEKMPVETMDSRLKKIQDDLMKFAKEKRLGYCFEYISYRNVLKAKFWENGRTRTYEICGDGCKPATVIADRIMDLTVFFKLKSSTVYGDLPAIKDIIFNDPATIIFWVDGTKTVVKAQDEAYDPEKGMAMAIAKKALGNKHDYFDVFKRYCKKYEKQHKAKKSKAKAKKEK